MQLPPRYSVGLLVPTTTGPAGFQAEGAFRIGAVLACRQRYPMTLHLHRPEVEKMLVTVDGFDTPRSLWHTDPAFRTRILSEWDKIEPYKAKGFIAEWPA